MEAEIKKPKAEKTERERQTFFRVTFKNNCNLLQIADNKANMVISINALVISSIIAITGYGMVSQVLDFQGLKMVLPISLIAISCFVSMVLAVQAARPKIITKQSVPKDHGKSSILFFGESSTYSLQDYLNQIESILPSKKEIHEQMAIALYYQGKVLNRKYKLLSYAYLVFILGLAFGLLTFLVYLILMT
jgi:Family of unknown function (DUF5706)